MKIGNVTVDPPLLLAPMAGVTDQPFRLLVKEQGCGLLVSEMVSCKGLLYNNQKTKELLHFERQERPFAVQLFGADPDEMGQAAAIVETFGPDMIDINMGCPVPKVVNNGEGSALLKQPALIEKIVAQAVKSVKIPVTVKIRSGWDETSINAAEAARAAECGGASAVAVHARTRSQFYTGKADWRVIEKVVASVSIPVIGNGDIHCGEDALSMIKTTGCAAVMVGRAAEGNPWLFAGIMAALQGKEAPAQPTYAERFAMLLRHFAMLAEYKGENIAVKEMRHHAAAYTKGLPHSAQFRRRFNTAATGSDFALICREYQKQLAIC